MLVFRQARKAVDFHLTATAPAATVGAGGRHMEKEVRAKVDKSLHAWLRRKAKKETVGIAVVVRQILLAAKAADNEE